MQLADDAICRKVLASSGSNFALPLRLLPTEKRRGSIALYAFCRLADDIVDDQPDSVEAASQLKHFEFQLREALAGRPCDEPVLRAIAATVDRFNVPQEHLFAIIDGVRLDLVPQPYQTVEDLVAYCRKVASAVGLAAVPIWGLRAGVVAADWTPAADACGLAFQWTNILRDIVEDRSRGRLYLPADSLAAAGCDPDGLVAGRPALALAALANGEVARCRRWFREAAELDRLLSADGQRVFRAMYGVYRELFRAVELAGPEIFSRRVRPPKWRLLASGIASMIRGPL
jgi:phytoene synthase